MAGKHIPSSMCSVHSGAYEPPKAARSSVQLHVCLIAQNGICIYSCRLYHKRNHKDKISVASSRVCALAIAITIRLPQRVFPIVLIRKALNACRCKCHSTYMYCSWTLLAASGGSYAPHTLHLSIMATCDLANFLNAIDNPEYQNPCLMSFCVSIYSVYI